jgi:hypothetical protein
MHGETRQGHALWRAVHAHGSLCIQGGWPTGSGAVGGEVTVASRQRDLQIKPPWPTAHPPDKVSMTSKHWRRLMMKGATGGPR